MGISYRDQSVKRESLIYLPLTHATTQPLEPMQVDDIYQTSEQVNDGVDNNTVILVRLSCLFASSH